MWTTSSLDHVRLVCHCSLLTPAQIPSFRLHSRVNFRFTCFRNVTTCTTGWPASCAGTTTGGTHWNRMVQIVNTASLNICQWHRVTEWFANNFDERKIYIIVLENSPIKKEKNRFKEIEMKFRKAVYKHCSKKTFKFF